MENSDCLENAQIAVVGLGNVGLPLAIELGKKYPTIGFDVDIERVASLSEAYDNRTLNKLSIPSKLSFTYNIQHLKTCNIYIVCVSTAIDADGKPELSLLLNASRSLSFLLKKGDLIIYESTVFPGCTEDVCVPLLEHQSKLKYNTDFFVGYSPERINTADTVHTLTNTIKITAGSTKETANKVDELYKSIIEAGTYPVASIRIAEASKLLSFKNTKNRECKTE